MIDEKNLGWVSAP